MNEIVYTLCRVSTINQVDKIKEDIPMQKEACREFAERMEWTIGKEFLEKGVSGFKVSASDRDAIQKLKAAALRHEFNILLVYMFDRIGRIDDETPFVVEWFVKHGIRVWSVQEGEQRFENHVDKLLNYICFWQASGESQKTSMRIRTRIHQLRSEGAYTGGPVPFSYHLEHRGRLNKKGCPIGDLAVEPIEAEWVMQIFEKTVKDGYGSYRLAMYLNNNGVRTHNGSKFQCNTILRILSNRLYTGYMTAGETMSPRMKELQIIDDKLFERAQYILAQRRRENQAERQIAWTTKGQGLLSGMMFCAHCGGRMTSNMHTEKYATRCGIKEKHYLRYICYHRSRKLCECDGQSVYSAEKVDKAVENVVADMFSRIDEAPDEAELRRDQYNEIQKMEAKLAKLDTELRKYRLQDDRLNEEIANTLIGESVYSPQQLSAAMKTVKEKMDVIGREMAKIKNEVALKKTSIDKVRPMYEQFKGWAEEFRLATVEQKKMIVSQVVRHIELGKGYNIKVVFNKEYEQFCNGLENVLKISETTKNQQIINC